MATSPAGEPAVRTMRPFFIIWSGQAVSILGSQLAQFGIVWYITKTTGSATLLATATLMALLPQILLSPFAGALVDRWNRRKVMIAADSTIALTSLVLAGLFWLKLAPLWVIYLALLIRSAGGAFHWPAMQASTTLMVPARHLARVGGMNQSLNGIASILIPPLGALALESFSLTGVLVIDMLTALPAILPLLFIHIPQPPRLPALSALSFWQDVRIGMQFVLRWKGLSIMLVWGILINMLGQAAGSLSPLLVNKHFQGGPLVLGWFQSASGIGLLLGGVLLSVWGGFKRKVVTQLVFMVLDGAAFIAIGLSPQNALAFSIGMWFLTSVFEAIAIGLSGALFQAIIPPEMQGRLFGLSISLTQALAPLGLLAAGPTADALGVPFWYLLTGILFSVTSLVAFLIPAFIHIEDAAQRPNLAVPAPVVPQ